MNDFWIDLIACEILTSLLLFYEQVIANGVQELFYACVMAYDVMTVIEMPIAEFVEAMSRSDGRVNNHLLEKVREWYLHKVMLLLYKYGKEKLDIINFIARDYTLESLEVFEEEDSIVFIFGNETERTIKLKCLNVPYVQLGEFSGLQRAWKRAQKYLKSSKS